MGGGLTLPGGFMHFCGFSDDFDRFSVDFHRFSMDFDGFSIDQRICFFFLRLAKTGKMGKR